MTLTLVREYNGLSSDMGSFETAPTTGRSVIQLYKVRAIVGRSLAQPYAVAASASAAVGKSVVLPYGVKQIAGASEGFVYKLAGSLGVSLALSYDVISAVTATAPVQLQILLRRSADLQRDRLTGRSEQLRSPLGRQHAGRVLS